MHAIRVVRGNYQWTYRPTHLSTSSIITHQPFHLIGCIGGIWTLCTARYGDRRGVGEHWSHPHEKAAVHTCIACSQGSVKTQVQGLAYTRKSHDGDPHTRQVERGDLVHECLVGVARRLKETHTQTGVTTIGVFRHHGSSQSDVKPSIVTNIITSTTTIRITSTTVRLNQSTSATSCNWGQGRKRQQQWYFATAATSIGRA